MAIVGDEVVVVKAMVAVEVATIPVQTAVVMVVEPAAAVLAREPGKTRIRPAEGITIGSEVMTRRWLAPAGLLEDIEATEARNICDFFYWGGASCFITATK